MQVGNNFSRVCLSASACISVQAIILNAETINFISIPVHTYIYTVSRSSLSAKVIGSRSRSNK